MLDLAIMEYMIPLIAVFIFSVVCALVKRTGSFSTPVFLTAFSIGILVLMWIPVLPIYVVIIPILIIIGMLFMNPQGSVSI